MIDEKERKGKLVPFERYVFLVLEAKRNLFTMNNRNDKPKLAICIDISWQVFGR